jgi:hypothetical protein
MQTIYYKFKMTQEQNTFQDYKIYWTTNLIDYIVKTNSRLWCRYHKQSLLLVV